MTWRVPTGRAIFLVEARARRDGLLVDGRDVDVFVGYGRDHDRQVGAGTFTARLEKGKILFQRVPDFIPPIQQRFLRNALAWLCTG